MPEAKKVEEIRLHGRAIWCGKDNGSHRSDIKSRIVSFPGCVLQSIPGLDRCQLRANSIKERVRVPY